MISAASRNTYFCASMVTYLWRFVRSSAMAQISRPKLYFLMKYGPKDNSSNCNDKVCNTIKKGARRTTLTIPMRLRWTGCVDSVPRQKPVTTKIYYIYIHNNPSRFSLVKLGGGMARSVTGYIYIYIYICKLIYVYVRCTLMRLLRILSYVDICWSMCYIFLYSLERIPTPA